MNFSRKLRGDCVHIHGQYRARDANDVGLWDCAPFQTVGIDVFQIV